MSRSGKRVYRALAWIFAVIIASGTFIGCRGGSGASKYGAPRAKYVPPTSDSSQPIVTSNDNTQSENVTMNE